MTWKDWAVCIILVPPLMLVAVFLAGSLIEGYGEHRARVAACQQQAATPHDYFQC